MDLLKKKYLVNLSKQEKAQLEELTKKGQSAARKIRRANIILLADEGLKDKEIAKALNAAVTTVELVRKRLVEEGLEAALAERGSAGPCGTSSMGRGRLTSGGVGLQRAARGKGALDDATLGRPAGRGRAGRGDKRRDAQACARKGDVKPRLKKRWCIPEVGARFVWRMEDVLDLYEEPHDQRSPVVCFDELLCQLVAEKRTPLPPKPGRPARYDYEYERKGTANVFAFFEPEEGWRHLDVTERRTARDFALAMRRLADEHYPKAEKIRVVLDNLNTRTGAALYEAFEPAQARCLLRRLEFHHTPEHASWLNQVEIELSVLSRQCLSERRIRTSRRSSGNWPRGSGSATRRERRLRGASRRRTPGRS